MTDAAQRTGAVEAVERILNREGEADAILRQTVDVLAERFATGATIRFSEDGSWTTGPAAGGGAGDAPGTSVPVSYRGEIVAELASARALDADDRAAWVRIGVLVSPYCLVGWDTGGEDWEP